MAEGQGWWILTVTDVFICLKQKNCMEYSSHLHQQRGKKEKEKKGIVKGQTGP